MRKIYIVLVCCLYFILHTSTAQTQVLNTDPERAPDLFVPGKEDVVQLPQTEEAYSNANRVMGCPSSNTLVTGYPAWTHYWAGWMVNINNVSTSTINIECFEARFDGTSGYRIYTKSGTFVGFETTAGAWSLLGSAANVTSISTTTSTPIPIAINQVILPGATQAFYFTRTDNTVANRHLYIIGTGTPGTTVYSSDSYLQVTEANYIDTYFINMGGTRRPSFQIYYTIVATLPIELKSFTCSSNKLGIALDWTTSTERGNDHFAIERSADGKNFEEIAKVGGAGNSTSDKNYKYLDKNPLNGTTYYRLKQVDVSRESAYSDLTSCTFERGRTKINIFTYAGILLASVETEDYATAIEQLHLNSGIYMIEFTGTDPVYLKHIQN